MVVSCFIIKNIANLNLVISLADQQPGLINDQLLVRSTILEYIFNLNTYYRLRNISLLFSPYFDRLLFLLASYPEYFFEQ